MFTKAFRSIKNSSKVDGAAHGGDTARLGVEHRIAFGGPDGDIAGTPIEQRLDHRDTGRFLHRQRSMGSQGRKIRAEIDHRQNAIKAAFVGGVMKQGHAVAVAGVQSQPLVEQPLGDREIPAEKGGVRPESSTAFADNPR